MIMPEPQSPQRHGAPIRLTPRTSPPCERHALEPLPAGVSSVAAYLAGLGKAGLRASTITRRAAGIRYMHRMAGTESPTSSEAIKAVLAGIRRSIGTAVTRKAPATAETVRAWSRRCQATCAGSGDRALLVLGFAGALRRSELVALDVSDLEETAEGLHVRIKHSKTDPGRGWRLRLYSARLTASPCCRPYGVATGGWNYRMANLPLDQERRLSDSRKTLRPSVAQIIKGRAEAAGFDPTLFSGHSLRAGFVTSALHHGADILRLMDVTRHREVSTLKTYDRRAKAFKQHAGEAFL